MIWVRVSGPRRYDIAQRDLEDLGAVLVHVVHQEHAVAERAEHAPDRLPVEARAAAGRRALESVEHAHLVALGLQPPDEPRAGVRERLVVEIDRVLRGEHHPDAERARLLEQREHRLFDGGFAIGGR